MPVFGGPPVKWVVREESQKVITQLTKGFDLVFLHGLATTRSGQPVTLMAHRQTIHRRVPTMRDPAALAGLPSLATIDPLGPDKWNGARSISLEVKAKHFSQCLGEGSCGTVLPALATPAFVSDAGEPSVNAHFQLNQSTLGPVPPFALKLAKRATQGSYEGGHLRLTQEAWLYEKMDALQGSIVPRCYGYFHAQLDADWILPAWLEADESWIMGNDEGVHAIDETTPSPRGIRRNISFLLLERLGDRLSPGGLMRGMDGKSVVKADLTEIGDLYKDLARLGIQHAPQDIRAANILRVPFCPPGLPGERSPYSRRAYNWRIVNFDSSDAYGGKSSFDVLSGSGKAERYEDLKEYYSGSLDILLDDVMNESPGLYEDGAKRVKVSFNLNPAAQIKTEPTD